MYRIPSSVRDVAENMVLLYGKVATALMGRAPPLTVHDRDGRIVYRWVAVGERFYHPVYVTHRFDRDTGAVILTAMPPYPAYLLATMGLYVRLGYHPSGVVLVSGGRYNVLRGLLSPGWEEAVGVVLELLQSPVVVLDPAQVAGLDVGFEGYMYRTPLGYVAFENRKLSELYDYIVEHTKGDRYMEEVLVEIGEKLLGG